VSTERLPYVRSPGGAATRSATSFWSISAISVGAAAASAGAASASAMRIGFPTLYGRLPTITMRPPPPGRSAGSARQSKRSASA
jgi:hypothetical protein